MINLSRYIKNLISSFQLLNNWENEKGRERGHGAKQVLENLTVHSKIIQFNQALTQTYNGLCLKMGTKINDSDYVILVDIDNKNDTIIKRNDLLKPHHKTINLKTPTATKGNNGLHYYFKLSEDKYNKIQKSYTTLTINDIKLDIDVKAGNGLQLAEPSRYTALDGSIKKYSWTNDSIYKFAIMDLPIRFLTI